MICAIDICEREAVTAGLCNAHYERKRLGRYPLDAPIREWVKQEGDCTECGLRRAVSKGLCKSCRSRRDYLAYALKRSRMYPWR